VNVCLCKCVFINIFRVQVVRAALRAVSKLLAVTVLFCSTCRLTHAEGNAFAMHCKPHNRGRFVKTNA